MSAFVELLQRSREEETADRCDEAALNQKVQPEKVTERKQLPPPPLFFC